MAPSKNVLLRLMAALGGDSPSPRPRRTRRMTPALDGLEDRVVLSHLGGFHRHAHLLASLHAAHTSTTASTSTATTAESAESAESAATSTTGTTTSSSDSAVAAARQQLRKDVQAIELASGATIGQLTAIRVGFQTLAADGLTPSSQSALSAFENSLVTANASGTTLAGNATLLAQFEALYTASPTAQETTDLTATYNALAAAVTSSNITAANIATIDADQTALLTAEGSTSTETFPYFSLVTGRAGGVGAGCHGERS